MWYLSPAEPIVFVRCSLGPPSTLPSVLPSLRSPPRTCVTLLSLGARERTALSIGRPPSGRAPQREPPTYYLRQIAGDPTGTVEKERTRGRKRAREGRKKALGRSATVAVGGGSGDDALSSCPLGFGPSEGGRTSIIWSGRATPFWIGGPMGLRSETEGL